MLDIRIIRAEPDAIRQGLEDLGADATVVGTILELDERHRALTAEVEGLKQQRNAESKKIGEIKKSGGNADEQQAAVRKLGEDIAKLDQEDADVAASLNDLMLGVPNLPSPTTPRGADETANVVVRTHGDVPHFDFEPKTHIELGESLGIFDFKRAARMSGAGFPLFVGAGAKLVRGLISYMIDLHVEEHGYTEVLPPFLCHGASMTGTGQLPKMAEDMYRTQEDDLYLVPTAEVPVTNIYREEIIEEPLPILHTAYTPCFRREAGAAGKDTRGLIRVHQFDKVEMVQFVEPSTSYEALESLTDNAEDVLRRLGLPYRVIELCSGDLSFAAAKCYDLELWAPGQNDWLEVSSCSNFLDFQARRAGIRYRDADGKPAYLHTLNGSGVALPRLIVALLENGQNADGSITLPEPLAPYLGGMTVLNPAG